MKARRAVPAEIMTVEQVADYLQLTRLTIYAYIRDGRLSASKLGKSYRIRLSDVHAFLDNAKHGRSRHPSSRRPRTSRIAASVSAEDVYVGPQPTTAHERLRLSNLSPLEWVVTRGLH